MPPSSRAGFTVCVHKKRALLFGGVVDMEMEGLEIVSFNHFLLSESVALVIDFSKILAGDVMMSLFLNELYGFQLDNRRW